MSMVAIDKYWLNNNLDFGLEDLRREIISRSLWYIVSQKWCGSDINLFHSSSFKLKELLEEEGRSSIDSKTKFLF